MQRCVSRPTLGWPYWQVIAGKKERGLIYSVKSWQRSRCVKCNLYLKQASLFSGVCCLWGTNEMENDCFVSMCFWTGLQHLKKTKILIAVKILIAINHIQNNSFCLHTCMYTVCFYYVYINTNTCMHIFKINMSCLYIKSIYIYNIRIHIYILHVYLYIHNIHCTHTYFIQTIFFDVICFYFVLWKLWNCRWVWTYKCKYHSTEGD